MARQILVVAEQLFADEGIAGVSLRQIAHAAGTANNSAVHYYFGTKDDLLIAIFRFRHPELLRRRALLKERVDPKDLRAVVEAHFLPLLELAEAPDCAYVSFIEQIERRGPLEIFTSQPVVVESHNEFLSDMQRMLKSMPEPMRTARIRQVQALVLHVAAERERAVNRDDAREPFGLFVSAVVDGVVGFLTAPVSAETRRLARRAETTGPPPGSLV